MTASSAFGWFNLPLSPARIKRTLDTIHGLLAPKGVFLFDFFQFKDLVVAPTQAQSLPGGLVYVSHSQVLGNVLRRYHLWIRKGRAKPLIETSDLVDRSAREVRGLLEESGLTLRRTKFLNLNYPREFWLAQKKARGRSRSVPRGARAGL